MTTQPRVLISYSHDSDAHRERVLDLAQRLRGDDVDAWIDQFEPAPAQGWPQWMREQVGKSEFVVLVCTPTYRRRFEGTERPGVGKGVAWESMLLDQLHYEGRLTHETIVPVYFEGRVEDIVPMSVRSGTSHALLDDYERLVRRLKRTLAVPPAPLGGSTPAPPRSAEDEVEARRAREVEQRRTSRRGHVFAVGDLVAGRHRLREHVENGGFAEVWKAIDERKNRLVAVKVLHGQWSHDQSRIDRFVAGAEKMETLQHPGIVSVYGEVREEQGRHLYVMPWYAKGDLRRAVLSGAVTREQALEAVASALGGLIHAHARGMVHRDVKPHNILIGEDGKGAISDFDLALAKGSTQGTRTGMGLGSVLYAAPEALTDASDVDVRADVYGAGLCVIFVLTGKDPPPFVALAKPALIEQLACDARLQAAVRGAVAYDRELRTTTSAELVAALRDFASGTRVASAKPTWAHDSGSDEFGTWATLRVGAVEQKMRWIPPGRFTMGSPVSEEGRYDDERPQHEIAFTQGFWLADTPCTQALWQVVMETDPSRFKGATLPVETVSWDDAQAFMRALNARVPQLDAALPTEARWEYACRATTTAARYGELDKVAWHFGNSGTKTHEVGRKEANGWGLYDMLGNVWEWCENGFGAYGTQALVDPPPARGPKRVIRGGSWLSYAQSVRAANRRGLEPGFHNVNLGFRFVVCQGLRQDR